ncbi:response regulator [Myxosarcina sp. GI1]|uniref:response regulator n=1 Tax=Myxosarcina sp. GI1 TaxID=1541065 RepID=UPI00055F9A00|nr:response regulator [Myxosarcina sp. GI1]
MSKISILIVEDELIPAYNLSNFLKRNDYRVVGIANSGEKALEMVEKDRPNIVLMDILLRGNLNGIETARRLQEKSNIAIVYQTAFSDLETKQQAKLAGNYFYIIKPFQFSNLLKILKEAVELKI